MTGLSQKITVAMITMNEERAIKKVIGDILAALPDVDVVIVDSSKDRTPEIAESMGVRVIRQFPPKGYGPAMDKALHASDRPVIVTMDCDDTYPVSFIEPMARMVLEDGYDVVDGSRLHNGKPAAMPWFNYFANLGFSMIASVLFFRYLTDLHSGMRAYRTSLLNNLRYTTNGDALPVELLLRPIREGSKVKVIGIPYRIRIGESTMNPMRSAWWTVKRICFARFFESPTMMSHAAQPIAARKALLVLLLFFAAQLFTLVVFFAASVAVFHIFAGGIFFYKCMVISLVWSIALFIGFLWFSNLRALRDLLMSAQVHPGWFAFFNAMTHFLSVMLFVMIVPGAIDRSQSVFLIGIMGEHPEHTYTADELQQIFIRTYVKDGDAIGRRMDEQLVTGTIVRDGNGFRLTPQGLGTLKTMKLFAFIFNVDTRYVDPQTAHSRKPPQPAP